MKRRIARVIRRYLRAQASSAAAGFVPDREGPWVVTDPGGPGRPMVLKRPSSLTIDGAPVGRAW